MSDDSDAVTSPTLHRFAEMVAVGPHSFIAECVCGKQSTDTTKAKASARLDRHIADKNRELCPTPAKNAYATERDAIRGMGATWRIQHGDVAASRVYRCDCGSWHLTHTIRRAGSTP